MIICYWFRMLRCTEIKRKGEVASAVDKVNEMRMLSVADVINTVYS
jgi:hypothetical protein